MAIKGNAATEESQGSSQLFTGIAAWRVVAVNPTQEELKAMGYKAEKAPEYVKTLEDGTKRTSIVFHVEATAPGGIKIKTNAAFFIKNKLMTDVYINQFGKFSKNRDEVPGNVRNPYDGEIDLLMFIADWANVKMKKGEEEELTLDTIQKIAENGDVTEVRNIFKNISSNIFKALATVSEGKYQRIYTKKMARSWSTDYSFIHKDLVRNQSYLKDDIGAIDLKVYIPAQFQLKKWEGAGAALAAAATASTNGNGSHQSSAPAPGVMDDDSPAPF